MMTWLQIQSILKEVWNDLPALLGAKMNEFESRLLPMLRAMEASPLDSDMVDQTLEMLEDEYPDVYDRMIEAMAESEPVPSYRSSNVVHRPAMKRYLVVPVWYATDRKNTGDDDPAERYSGERGALQYGRVEVSIPDTHKKGKLEKPSLFRLEFREDPEKHVVLLTLEQLGEEEWKAELKQKLAICSRHDVLLFIHGYNVSFRDAARRAAQFAHDLEFQGLTVLYSWPSEGTTLKYTIDEDNAHWTVDHFEQVLPILMTDIGAEHLHAVAHSMGNRVLTEGLRRIDTTAFPPGSAKLREVVFAAPDVNADTFRTFVEKFHARAERFTLYASNADKALEASQFVHKYPRAGDIGDGVLLTQGLETIDASAVDISSMGHSYFCDNRSIIQDIFNLIMKGEGAATPRYGLKEQKTPEGRYWALHP